MAAGTLACAVLSTLMIIAFPALPTGASAPSGFTKAGISVFPCKDLAGHNQGATVDLYRKN
jgi:hypothetical protein